MITARQRVAHLLALWAFAFAQPLLDLLGRNPDFFVARGNGSADIVLFAVAFTVGPPLVLFSIEEITRRISAGAEQRLHVGLVALLAAATVLGFINETSPPGGVLIALAVLAGVLFAAAYVRFEALRSGLGFLLVAPVAFLALFLLTSESSRLVLPQDEVKALDVESNDEVPIVVVILDEFPLGTLTTPDGEIDAKRFPAFGRLAKDATWYRRATTAANFTPQAVPAILTGMRPEDTVEPSAEAHPESLFTVFGNRATNAYESFTQVCPDVVCPSNKKRRPSLSTRMRELVSDLTVVSEHLLLPESIQSTLPPVDQNFSGFGGQTDGGDADDRDRQEKRENQVKGFLRDLQTGSNSLNYLHMPVPHVPWNLLPNGDRCQPEIWKSLQWTGPDSDWVDDPFVLRQALALHLLQAGYSDTVLGEVRSELERSGIWDDAVVVVTSDHGASFKAGTVRRSLEGDEIGQTASVPLFVKLPGQRGGEVSDSEARTIDILPTIAQAVDADLPFETDGVALGEEEQTGIATIFDTNSEEAGDYDLDRIEEGRRHLAEQKEQLLSDSGGLAAVYGDGPRPDLVGEMAAAEGDPAGEATLVAPESYEDVDTGSASIPCQLLAEVGKLEPGTPVAASVNGVVVATTQVYEAASGANQAFALLNPVSFEDGLNEIELFVIEGEGTGTQLRPLGLP